jgi:hypothetical protein
VLLTTALLGVTQSGAAQGNGTQADAECKLCHDYWHETWHAQAHDFNTSIGGLLSCSTGMGCHTNPYLELCLTIHNSSGCGSSDLALQQAQTTNLALTLGDHAWASMALHDSSLSMDEFRAEVVFRGCGRRSIARVPVPLDVVAPLGLWTLQRP